ncbi:MAG: branched-chain amino acid ABC transporter permease [Desulfatiglans sp.]|jgi:branched-chain amino acid transport system permease protein|nr:branched-chain amino acid ABC transporter permease [Desulfatiglans sp.]
MLAGVFVYGLVNSMMLALFAVGFGLTFGVSRIANFAHGAIYILAGYLVWIFMNMLDLPLGLSIVLSLILTVLCGIMLYKGILERVRGMAVAEIISTFALGLAIAQLFKFFGFIGPKYAIPTFFKGSISIIGVSLDFQRLLIIGVGAILITLLWLFSHYTKTGLAFRAVALNERTAMTLGVSSNRIAIMNLAIGCGLAGLAAIVIAPIGTLSIEAGLDVLIYAVAISFLGGLGNMRGLFAASFLLGYTQTIVATYIGSHWLMIATLACIYLVLVLRPSGLFGKSKELEERV